MYAKGVRKENYLVDKYRKMGYSIVQRMAGSHSPVDLIAIDTINKKIKMIQSKRTLARTMDYINPKIKDKLEKKNNYLNGFYLVEFIAL